MEPKDTLILAINNSLPCGVADACTLRAVSSSAARAVAAAPALRVAAGVSPTSAREWSTVHAMAQAQRERSAKIKLKIKKTCFEN